ncbi:hypothetical protein GCM10023307_24800 [Lysobacter hankyongensis]|uniref:Uncharacterized protein n=1 Tax=Lysobacter hankyongensis TaxID=1176535 RepID=A0ABP9BQZ5_9GAMM
MTFSSKTSFADKLQFSQSRIPDSRNRREAGSSVEGVCRHARSGRLIERRILPRPGIGTSRHPHSPESARDVGSGGAGADDDATADPVVSGQGHGLADAYWVPPFS